MSKIRACETANPLGVFPASVSGLHFQGEGLHRRAVPSTKKTERGRTFRISEPMLCLYELVHLYH